ncbi:hypothetical protein P2318_21980 [Myxococcaceae bacterium GXIMD 01537]
MKYILLSLLVLLFAMSLGLGALFSTKQTLLALSVLLTAGIALPIMFIWVRQKTHSATGVPHHPFPYHVRHKSSPLPWLLLALGVLIASVFIIVREASELSEAAGVGVVEKLAGKTTPEPEWLGPHIISIHRETLVEMGSSGHIINVVESISLFPEEHYTITDIIPDVMSRNVVIADKTGFIEPHSGGVPSRGMRASLTSSVHASPEWIGPLTLRLTIAPLNFVALVVDSRNTQRPKAWVPEGDTQEQWVVRITSPRHAIIKTQPNATVAFYSKNDVATIVLKGVRRDVHLYVLSALRYGFTQRAALFVLGDDSISIVVRLLVMSGSFLGLAAYFRKRITGLGVRLWGYSRRKKRPIGFRSRRDE